MAVSTQTPAVPGLASSSRQAAFTLIELLVVILIIGILIAIAVPTFLNQQQKAQNSAAQQTLAVAYKDAKANMATNGGTFPDYQTLAAQIASAEPEYTVGTAIFSSDQAVTAGPYGKLWVLLGSTGSNGTLASTNGQNLYLADVSKSGAVCTLTVTNDGPPVYGNCGGTSSGSAGAAAVAPTFAAGSNLATTGTPVQGQSLSTNNSNSFWNSSPSSYTYQWQRCDTNGANCQPISGATGSSYTPVAADVGMTLRAVVTAVNSAGSAQATSSATSAIISAWNNAVQNLNPAVWWKMNGNLTDSGSAGDNGSVSTGTLSYTTNNIPFSTAGSALSFASGYAQAPDNAAFRGNAITYAAWVDPTNISNTQDPINYQNNNGWRLQLPSGQAQSTWIINNSNSLQYASSPVSSFSANTWYFIAVTASNSTNQAMIYINGQLAQTFSSSFSASNFTTGPILIGGAPVFSENYTGYQSQVQIYTQALTGSQILGLYNASQTS